MVPSLIGTSKSIERIRGLIKHTADTGLNVLITGETGVGKKVVALNLYYKSLRNNKPFMRVNCAALPGRLLERELFGFERYNLTGVDQKKRGQFELAHQGVLFLDEIGETPLNVQKKLLNALQSGEFIPLGSEKKVRADIWFIASTKQELTENIKKGRFREDLYYRLNIIKIYIPPLRKRSEDIPLLIDHYFKEYTSQFSQKKLTYPSNDTIEKLISYSWPGNVSELKNVIKNCIVVGSWEEVFNDITFKDKSGVNLASLKEIRKQTMDIIEKEIISQTLNKTGWNRTKASKILKIHPETLHLALMRVRR